MAGTSDILRNIGTNVVGPLLIGIAGYFVLKFSEWYKKYRKNTSLLIKTAAKRNERIQELLVELRIKTCSDRTFLALFHNGNRYINGSEILKMSRTNETCNPGISLEALRYQDISVTLVPDLIKIITEEKPVLFKVNDLEDGKFKRLLIGSGVKTVCRYPIKMNKDMVGFVGLDYSYDIDVPMDLSYVMTYAALIEEALTSYK